MVPEGVPSILPGVRMVSNFFQREGVSRYLIIPYLIPYNLCFLRRSGVPSGSKHVMLGYLDAVTKVRFLKRLSILNLPEYMVSGKTAI